MQVAEHNPPAKPRPAGIQSWPSTHSKPSKPSHPVPKHCRQARVPYGPNRRNPPAEPPCAQASLAGQPSPRCTPRQSNPQPTTVPSTLPCTHRRHPQPGDILEERKKGEDGIQRKKKKRGIWGIQFVDVIEVLSTTARDQPCLRSRTPRSWRSSHGRALQPCASHAAVATSLVTPHPPPHRRSGR